MKINKKIPLTPEQLADATRLKELYQRKSKSLKINQNDIADELGVGQSAISHYLNAVNPLNPRAAAAFAKVLHVSISDFSPRLADELRSMKDSAAASGSQASDFFATTADHRSLPLLNPKKAADWSDLSSIHSLTDTTDFLQTNLTLSGSAFAFTIKDDSMQPEFNEGDVVICDPKVSRVPGDFVIAQIGDSEEAIFRRYRLISAATDNEVFELFPLNNVHAAHRSDIEKIRVIGVMVEHRKYRQAPKR